MLLGRSNSLRISPSSLIGGRYHSSSNPSTPAASSSTSSASRSIIRPPVSKPSTPNQHQHCPQCIFLASSARPFSSTSARSLPTSSSSPLSIRRPDTTRRTFPRVESQLPSPFPASIPSLKPPSLPPDPPTAATEHRHHRTSSTPSSASASTSLDLDKSRPNHPPFPHSFQLRRSSSHDSILTPTALQIIESLSRGTVLHPTDILNLVRSSHLAPSALAFARKTLEHLFVLYVEIYFRLSLRGDESEKGARDALLKAALSVENGLAELSERRMENGILVEDQQSPLVLKELIRICVELEDWEALRWIADVVLKRNVSDAGLSRQLKHAIQAYLASSFILTLAAHDANIILGPLLSAAFKTSEDRSPSSVRRSPDDDLRAIWNAFLKVPRLHTPSIFGLLLDISVQRGDRALVVEIWESGKDVNNLLKQMASPYIACLASINQLSEVSPVLQLLIRQNVIATKHWQDALRAIYTASNPCFPSSSSSDTVATDFIIHHVRPHVSEEIALLLVSQLLSLRAGEAETGSRDRREMGHKKSTALEAEIRETLEEAFGGDVWERVEQVEVERERRRKKADG